VVAALPVHNQLQVIIDDVHDDLRDDGADDFLAGLRCSPRALPSSNQVPAKGHEALAIRRGEVRFRTRIELIDDQLQIARRHQALVPSPLQLAGYKPVLGIGGIILALRPGRLVTGLLQGKFKLVLLLGALLTSRLDRRQRRLDAQGLEAVQHLRGEAAVHAHSAEGDAPGRGQLVEGAHAFIAIGVPAIADVELLAAASAAQKPRQ
jgi:hypothetical protein